MRLFLLQLPLLHPCLRPLLPLPSFVRQLLAATLNSLRLMVVMSHLPLPRHRFLSVSRYLPLLLCHIRSLLLLLSIPLHLLRLACVCRHLPILLFPLPPVLHLLPALLFLPALRLLVRLCLSLHLLLLVWHLHCHGQRSPLHASTQVSFLFLFPPPCPSLLLSPPLPHPLHPQT